MKTLYLVSCVSQKLQGTHPAKELYVSSLFRKSRAYAESHADQWYVLSAKYGLLHPESMVESYDETLNTMDVAKRWAWAEKVSQGLSDILEPGDKVVFLAGKKYMENIVPNLQGMGVAVENPLGTLRFGERLKWLKEHLG